MSILFVTLFCSIATARADEPTSRPVPAIKRVMIVSIDGLRPDLALRADTPNIHALMQAGSFTFWARTTEISITLPSHVSMLTGVTPAKHHVDWNADVPPGRDPYPAVPTLFEIAHQHGLTCAIASGKSKFSTFARPGVLDWSYLPILPLTNDDDVARHATEIIRDHQPQVMFVHFPGVDSAGHAKGWASAEQMAAIHFADAALGEVIAAAKDAKTFDETLLIVTADHGGQGRQHGPNDDRSRHIPWIAVGPGVRAGYDLTQNAALTVNTEDTFATACFFLGLPVSGDIDGKPIQAILEKPGELLVNSPR
jgi:predicted AlkP superfamily pyrophosphatase or phosphodiesterase